jgi:hypothetical protein
MTSQVQYTNQPPQQAPGVNNPQQQQPIGDAIDQLPADTSVPSHNEIRIVDQLFQQKKGMFDHILRNTKDIVVLGLLFVIFSLPFLDNLIKRFVTIADTSHYALIVIKALLFVLVYFVIKNIYLVRKS